MAVIDTTNVVDSTMFLKNKFPHNKVSNNYYIQNLQEKRNRDWEFRPNLVDIEEELNKQTEYTPEPPFYSPIDVAIRKVKNEKGQDIGADWADLAFRDLKHFSTIGSRYRFDTEFPDMSLMTEEEKYYNTSIWVCVNKNPVDAGNNCIVRRCNSSLVFAGSPDGSLDNITETHIEPVVLDNDLKYINIYYNMTTQIPQCEWYATMQMNYFTNCIEINDRFIFGGVDLKNRSNNAVFKVKAVVKSSSQKTFAQVDSSEIDNIPLVIIALDKDTISSNDDFHSRLANQAPVYFTENLPPVYQYYLELNSVDEYGESKQIQREKKIQKDIDEEAYYEADNTYGEYQERIIVHETEYYKCDLKLNGKEVKLPISITAHLDLSGLKNDMSEEEESLLQKEYYELKVLENNTFAITNLRRYSNAPLVVTCSCIKPDEENMLITQEFELTLGGFY